MLTPEMPELHDLKYHQIHHLSAMDKLRFSVWREGGVWDSARALRQLRYLGWETTSRYPLNVAGNMLGRLEQEGSVSRAERGGYTPNLDTVSSVLMLGLRASKR